MWTCIVINFLIIEPNRCTNFSKLLFRNETLHVLDSSSVLHQELFTVHIAMEYVIQFCWHIPSLCVQRETPDDGQRNCPKHIDFPQNKNFEKLVHLICSIIRNKRIVFIQKAVHVFIWSPPTPSMPAKEFWRCPNDLLDNFPHLSHLSHYKTLVLIYLLFENSDKNKSKRP
jgi:hypothetical protein